MKEFRPAMACQVFSLFLLFNSLVPPLASSQTSPPCSTIPEPKINSDAGDVSTQTIIVPFACPCPPPGTDGKCDTTVKALGRFTLTRTGQQVLSDMINVSEADDDNFVSGTNLLPFQLYDVVLEWIYPNGTVLISKTVQQKTDADELSTLAPPENITVTRDANDITRITVSWQPPNFISRELIGYTVFVRRGRFELPIQQSLNSLSRNLTVENLLIGLTYSVTVAALQEGGVPGNETWPLQVHIGTMLQGPPIYVLYFINSGQNFEYYFTTGVSSVSFGIRFKDNGIDAHHVNEAVGMAIDVYNSRLYIGFKSGQSGHIFEFPVEAVEPIFYISAGTYYKTGLPDLGELATDWINRKLIWSQNESIISLGYSNKTGMPYKLVSSTAKPIDITVDPIRGYLYWSTVNGDIYRADLLTGHNKLSVHHSTMITSLSISGEYLFFLDSSTVFQLSLSDYSQIERVKDVDIIDFQVASGFLYEFRKSSADQVEFLVVSLKDSQQTTIRTVPDSTDDVGPVALYGSEVQPLPELVFAPSEFNVLFGSTTANVSFKRPFYNNSLAGPDGWMPSNYILKWSSEYTRNESEVASALDYITTTVWDLLPDVLYHFTLQVFIPSVRKAIGPITEFSGRTIKDDLSFVIGFSGSHWIFSTLDGSYQSVFSSTKQAISDIAVYVTKSSTFLFPIWSNTIGYLQTNISISGVSGLSDIDSLLSKPSLTALSNIEIDWLFERLFYSSGQQIRSIEIGDFVQTLNKDRVNNSDALFLIVDSQIDALAVGPLIGRVCWAATNVIGCVEFNGVNGLVKLEQQSIPSPLTVHGLVFSDQSVNNSGLLYELVQHQDVITVIGYNVTDNGISLPIVNHSQSDSSSSFEVAFLSKKLLWVSDLASEMLKIAEVSSNTNTMSVANLPLPISVKAMSVLFDQQAIRASLPCQNLLTVTPTLETNISVTEMGPFSGIYKLEWKPSIVSCGGPPHHRLDIVKTQFDGRSYSDIVPILGSSYLLNTTHFHPFTKVTVTLQAFTLWATSAVSTDFFTRPTKPGPPASIRVFYTCSSNSCDATLRWDPPIPPEQNGKIINYRVRGRTESNLRINETLDPASTTVNSYTFNPILNLHYTLEVSAVVEEAGEGESVDINQTFMSGESSPIPILTIVNTNSRFNVDVDTGMESGTKNGFSVKNGLITRIVHDDVLCWVSSNEKLLCLVDAKEIEVQGSPKLRYHGLAYDWISRKLYVSTEEGGVARIQKCDVIQDGCISIMPTYDLSENGIRNVTTLLVDAVKGSYWVTIFQNNRYELERHDISISNNNNRQVRSDAYNRDDILLSNIIAYDVQKQRILVQDMKNGIYSCSISVDACWLVVNATQLLRSVNASNMGDIGLPASSLTVDAQFIYWTSTGSQDTVYFVRKEDPTGLLQSSFESSGIQGIVAEDISQQPLPDDLTCLGPGPVVPTVTNTSDMTISLSWSAAGLTMHCGNNVTVFDLARVTYIIRYWVHNESMDNAKESETFDSAIEIEGLKPTTLYNFQIKAENIWNTGKGVFSDIITNETKEGKPSPPRNLTVQLTQNPTRIEVTWYPPEEENGLVRSYTIFLYNYQTGKEESNSTESRRSNLTVEPSQMYRIQVVAVNSFGESDRSDPVNITIYDDPPPPTLTVLSHSSIQLTLNKTLLASVEQWLNYKPYYRCKDKGRLGCVNTTCPISSKQWQLVSSDTNPLIISDLNPSTVYEFTMGLDVESYFSRREEEDTTEGFKPDAPIDVHLAGLSLRWGVSCNNGAEITRFCFQIEPSDSSEPSCFDTDGTTVLILESTKTAMLYALQSGILRPGIEYKVQIAGENSFGRGEFSDVVMVNGTAVSSSSSDDNAVVIAAVVASVVVLVVIILIIIVCIRHHRIVTKENFSVHYHTEDRELEMLRTVRRRTNQDVPFNFNPMYTVEKKLVDGLPSFPRSQLTLNDFLGQGQFGEVYMGVAHGIVAEEESTRVAVKTLRKDANEREREEFLTEARFMSNFQHPNILRLLGVCLDNNPQYMIMELMEGGDLLTFIRASRRDLDHSTLTLSDLVKISFDICAGGKYLEQSRFVHRDLACRNCLVSSKGFDRVVKIGDFGLARNIYENHYYRKEGEGLLPVRWMAPESLVDGLFTTQSDVWSFGVVLWEIFTLGHQPYPTQTNQEVLKFIVQGGRLERPDYCPEDIYGIMLMCWAHQPHDRPTFRALLERLKVLRNRVDRQSFLLEQQNTSSQQGSDSELEEEELTMELDETEREESARAATGEGQVHLGMPDATERYVSHTTMSRQNSSRHGRIRQSVGLTMSESLHGGGSGDTESNKGSPFVGKKRKESGSRRKSSGTSNGASKSSSSLKRLSKRFSKASTMSEEPDRVEIPSSGVVIEFGSSSRLI